MYQPPLFSAKNDNQELGIAFILKSMTAKQREVIKLIAKHQLANPEEKKGIRFKQLLNETTEAMIANNNKALKEYLAEARDHKVVQEKIDENGTTWLFMNFPPVVLEKIVSDTLNIE